MPLYGTPCTYSQLVLMTVGPLAMLAIASRPQACRGNEAVPLTPLCSNSPPHTLAHTGTHSHSHWHTHTLAHTLAHTHTGTHSHWHTHTLSLAHTLTGTHSHSHSHSPHVEVLNVDVLVRSCLSLAPEQKTFLCRQFCSERKREREFSTHHKRPRYSIHRQCV